MKIALAPALVAMVKERLDWGSEAVLKALSAFSALYRKHEKQILLFFVCLFIGVIYEIYWADYVRDNVFASENYAQTVQLIKKHPKILEYEGDGFQVGIPVKMTYRQESVSRSPERLSRYIYFYCVGQFEKGEYYQIATIERDGTWEIDYFNRRGEYGAGDCEFR